MFQARHLDRFIASDLSKQDWLNAVNFVQSKITYEVIASAMTNMPEEIYNNSSMEIGDKLKTRIKDLEKYVLEYYDMLSPDVDIIGSNKDEYFEILRNDDGSVNVEILIKIILANVMILYIPEYFSKMKQKI
ncbi:MAG: hypothetical protein IPH62_20005 [Ignavibacteriae bacterium]|nr:hypothetical protein [Ignavibacteriota bacterium]